MLLPRDHPNVVGAKAFAARGNPVAHVLEAIKAHLELHMAGTIQTIEIFGGDKKEFDIGENDTAITLLYQGSQYDRSGMAGALSASRSLTIMVVYLHRLLDGQEVGLIQQRMEDIRLALHGTSFAGSKPLVPIDDAIDDMDEGVCLCHITFEAVIPAIAAPPHRVRTS